MSKLSKQVKQLEQKADALEYENDWLKILLYRLITGDATIPIVDVDSLQFNAKFSEDENRMLSVSVMRDYNLIATKPI